MVLSTPKPKLLTPRWYPLRPVPVQRAYYDCPARFVVVPAGRRSGKTEIAKRRKIRKWMAYTGNLLDPWVIFGGPTHAQAKRIFWRDLNMFVPSEFIESIRESDMTMRLINGVEFSVIGLDVPQRVEGRSIADIVVDEFADLTPETWYEHVRPALADSGGGADIIGTPSGRGAYYQMFKNALADKTGEWAAFTWWSEAVLPPEEIESLKATMDPLTYQQECHADFIVFTGRVYYSFDVTKHVAKNVLYDAEDDLYFAFDFNVSPGVAVIAQYKNQKFYVIDEVWIGRNSNTMLVCNALIRKYGHHKGAIYCFGDATGGARGSAKIAGSDWDIIKRELRSKFADRVILRVPSNNPKERVRVNSVNSALHSGRVLIDGSMCPRLVTDLDETPTLEDGSGQIDKHNNPDLSHISDAFGYMVHYLSKGFVKLEVV